VSAAIATASRISSSVAPFSFAASVWKQMQYCPGICAATARPISSSSQCGVGIELDGVDLVPDRGDLDRGERHHESGDEAEGLVDVAVGRLRVGLGAGGREVEQHRGGDRDRGESLHATKMKRRRWSPRCSER
jgi:hypothetical protein